VWLDSGLLGYCFLWVPLPGFRLSRNCYGVFAGLYGAGAVFFTRPYGLCRIVKARWEPPDPAVVFQAGLLIRPKSLWIFFLSLPVCEPLQLAVWSA